MDSVSQTPVSDTLWPFSEDETAALAILVAAFLGYVVGALSMMGGLS